MSTENINRRLNIYINDREVVNSARGIDKEMAKVRGQMRNLVKGTEDYDKKLHELKDSYDKLKEKQVEFREEMQDTNKVLEEAREAGSKIFTGFSTGNAKMAQEGLNGIKGSLLGVIKTSLAFIATPIGATMAILAGIGYVAKQWFDYNDSIRESTRLIENLSGKTGDAAAQIRVGVKAIADTFKLEFDSVAKAVDNLVDTGVVKDEMEALEQIKNGLLKAPDSSEFISSLENTAETSRQLGLELKEVIALKESIEAKGVDPEKVFGALEKATKNLQSQLPSLRAELTSAFGAGFTDNLLKKIRTGEITVTQALENIGKKSKELNLNITEQQRLTTAIFGKSGIAAGGFAKIIDIVTVAEEKRTEGLTDMQKSLDELAKSELDVLQAQDNLLRSKGFDTWKTKMLSGWNQLKAAAYNYYNTVFNGPQANSEDIARKYIAKAKAEFEARNTKEFNDFITKQQASLKSNYDFQESKEIYLANLRKKLAEAGGGSWDSTPAQEILQKQIETQIDFIRKLEEAKKLASDKQTDDEKKADDEAAKKRAKALEDAKKHSEDLKKQLEVSENELLATKRAFQDVNLGNLKDGYEKERTELNVEYDRKLEDLKIKIAEEQKEIDKLRAEKNKPGTTGSDAALLQKQIDNKLELQRIYNATSISLEETRNIKLATLQEKYLQKEIKAAEEAHKKALQNLKDQQSAELEGLNTLSEAKAVLANYLSADELSKVTNLEDAKTRIKEEHLKAEYKLQEQYLVDAIARIQAIFAQEQITGIPIFTDEERKAMLEFLDEAAAKLANIKKGEANLGGDEKSQDLSKLSGIDILGFTAEQWQGAFDNLDSWAQKLEAIGTVIGGLKNAFGLYFQFIDAADKRSLQKFEAGNRRKQKELTDQLEKGYITQEVYNARKEKLDQDLAKKKAELEYKQAKREKLMNIANIISNTAMGVSKALAQGGFIFGIPWAAIVGALGAVQLAAAIAQPLPSKEGFKGGGYTGDGPDDNSPGPVHYQEYVVPRKVLFSNDPVVPSIVGYLEAKRTGKVPEGNSSSNNSSAGANQSGTSSNANDEKFVSIMERNATVLEKLEKYGVEANLVNDLKTAKKLRRKQIELQSLENQSKKS